ncbi:MAG: DUF4367 domain-containing protein [Oscillospiraceae bacterium]|nr:DUF4367 domain-containing protein [Oscillospiraceae bacterium]
MKVKREERPFTQEQVLDQYEKALFKLAFLELQEEETDRLQNDIDHRKGSPEDITQLIESSNPRMFRAVDRRVRRQHMLSMVGTTLPKAGKIAAGLLLIFFISLTTAVATVHSVRVKVMEIIFNIEDEYTEVSLREQEEAGFDVPGGWQGEYFPRFIPPGYSIDQLSCLSPLNSIMYTSADGDRIIFDECGSDVGANIDTEDAAITYVLINGNPGLIAKKANKTIISWADGDEFFILTCDFTGDIPLQIANSVTRIN